MHRFAQEDALDVSWAGQLVLCNSRIDGLMNYVQTLLCEGRCGSFLFGR